MNSNKSTGTARAEKATEQIKNHPVATAVVIILIIIFSVSIGVSKKEPVKNNEVDHLAMATTSQTFEGRIRELTNKIGVTKISFNSIEDTKADSNRPQGSRMIVVKLNVSSFLSSDSFYRNTGELTGKIFQETFSSNPNAYDVIVWYYADITDNYGNTKNQVLMSQSIDKETYQKINWKNFDSSKICDFLRLEGAKGNLNNVCVTKAKLN